MAPTSARAGFLLGEAPQRAHGARTRADGTRIPRVVPVSKKIKSHLFCPHIMVYLNYILCIILKSSWGRLNQKSVTNCYVTHIAYGVQHPSGGIALRLYSVGRCQGTKLLCQTCYLSYTIWCLKCMTLKKRKWFAREILHSTEPCMRKFIFILINIIFLKT